MKQLPENSNWHTTSDRHKVEERKGEVVQLPFSNNQALKIVHYAHLYSVELQRYNQVRT